MQLKDLFEEPASEQIAREVGIGSIKCWSGVYVDPMRPTLDTVRIDDIAHSLSLVCRYGGHCNDHYSVAQHCLEVSAYIEHLGGTAFTSMMGLLHDAEEAYFGDMPSPLKKHYPDYKKHGEYMRGFVMDKYIPGWRDVPRWYMEMVHQADQDMYQIERMSFSAPYDEAFTTIGNKYGWGVVNAKACKEVEAEYLRWFAALGREDRIPVEGRGAVSPKSYAEGY